MNDPENMDAFFNAKGGWQTRPAHWQTNPAKVQETKERIKKALRAAP